MDKQENPRRAEGITPSAQDRTDSVHDKMQAGPPLTPPAQVHAAESLAEDVPPEEPAFLSREWFVQNGPTLAIVTAVFIFAVIKLQFWGVVKAALGLSFVVFIHELGHFLAAKWCDVNVTVFSIGFGPTIPGCWFRRGETTYRLGLIPLGGYVQMVGQVDGDESSDGSDDDPRSFRNKTVSQRMLIISAGVMMNVILAILCFIVVFRGPGKDRMAGVIGNVDTGAPAFKHGLKPGAEILQLGDIKHPYFENLMVRVMGSLHGQSITLVTEVPGEGTEKFEIEPRFSNGKLLIGISPASKLQLEPNGQRLPENWTGPFVPNSVAGKATPAFAFGDRIVATTDPDQTDAYDPEKTVDLPDDPRLKDDPVYKKQPDFFVFKKRLEQLAGKDLVLVVERGAEKTAERLKIRVPANFYLTLGARMHMGQIAALRDGSPAEKAGVRSADKERNIKGDIIQKVEVLEPDGKTRLVFAEDKKTLDPERLPYQLRAWADRMAQAQMPTPWKVHLRVKRFLTFEEGRHQNQVVDLELHWDNSWRYVEMEPFGLSAPRAIPELGLAYRIKNVVASVDPAFNSDSGLQPGDVINEIRFKPTDPEQRTPPFELKEELEPWARVAHVLQGQAPLVEAVVLKVTRNKEAKEITLVPQPVAGWGVPVSGLLFREDLRRQRADSTTEAIALGFKDTWDSMVQVFQNVRGMIIGTISPTNLGGPVTIARVAYRLANMDFWEFVFFLGLISVNLAVINFLPIPVLDGGHMVFLIYEKIRGKPASEGVRIGATYAGLALILCLMVFVLYLDISRLFG